MIKFRAWYDGKMWSVANINFIDETVDIYNLPACENGEIHDVRKFSGGDLKLMQFTGIKDVNRKEIYEGDILKNTETGEISAIKKVDSFFRMAKQPMLWRGEMLGEIHYCDPADFLRLEVIGNIYENKDLLNA